MRSSDVVLDQVGISLGDPRAVGVDRQRARRSGGGGGLHGATWLRSFAFGQVRRLDKVTGELLTRAWAGEGRSLERHLVEVGE